MSLEPAYRRAVREAYCTRCSTMPSTACRNRYGGVQWPPHAERLAFIIVLDAEIARLEASAPESPGAEGRSLPSMTPSGASPHPPGGASGGVTP